MLPSCPGQYTRTYTLGWKLMGIAALNLFNLDAVPDILKLL